MKIKIYGEIIECASVIKKDNRIILLNENGSIIRKDCGISSFDGYEMMEGAWIDESNTPSQDEKRDAQIFYTAMMTDTLLEEV